MPRELPQTRKCPSHASLFPGEDEMRDISEFRINKAGQIAPTYCRQCQRVKQREYHQRLKSAEPKEPKEPSPMRALLDSLRDEVNELAAQVELGDEAELARLSEAFGITAAEKVRDVLTFYAEQRGQLPEKVYEMRNPPEEESHGRPRRR